MRKVGSKEIEKRVNERIRAVRESTLRSPMQNIKMSLEGYQKTKVECPLTKAMVGWCR